MRSAAYSGAWVPVFSSAAQRKGSEAHWIVGFDARHVFCIVCSSADRLPQVRAAWRQRLPHGYTLMGLYSDP